MIPVFRPSLSDKEIKAVTATLKSGWWGSGPKATEFEEKFSKYIKVKYACSLSSCTAALHLAGKVLNLKQNSEVITTPISFVSTPYLALYSNLKLVFADIEEDTLNIDPESIRKKISDKTKVILPVHFGGHACRMDEILEIAKENNLYVVEDCAHATGGLYKGKKLGSFGNLSCFSFQAVKNLAMGDGGMLISNNEEWIKHAKVLRWCGINKDTAERTDVDQYTWNYEINEIGYKYQMCDILAAIGIAQLERIEELNDKRKQIAKRYDEAFENIDWIERPVEKDYCKSSRHNYVAKVNVNRERLIDYLKNKGISTSVHYPPVYNYKVFSDFKANCPVADKIWKKIMNLPLYPDMTEKEINTVISAIKNYKE